MNGDNENDQCSKRTNFRKMHNADHKLNKLLPNQRNISYDLRTYNTLPVPLARTDRFRRSLIPWGLANKAVRQSPDLLFIATSFWFEESPCAVRTNTAGLGRLCTLFVCSTLLVFEHTHAVLSSTLVLCCTMVTTSTAAMSNSQYADTDRMKNVFLIRFSKPHLDRTKAGR